MSRVNVEVDEIIGHFGFMAGSTVRVDNDISNKNSKNSRNKTTVQSINGAASELKVPGWLAVYF